MLILKCKQRLSRAENARLREMLAAAFEGTQGHVLFLENGIQLFQHIDGRWVEIGHPIEDIEQLIDGKLCADSPQPDTAL